MCGRLISATWISGKPSGRSDAAGRSLAVLAFTLPCRNSLNLS
jgi:hypothetical protein